MPLISVIIPCYNHGQYIDETVSSVLAQTFHEFEIIIINDGSDDEFTNSKLNEYSNPKIKVITTENSGLAAARNRGFREAKGEYIQFLDADDTIQPLKFQEQLLAFNQFPEIDVCFTNFIIFDIDRQIIVTQPEDIQLSKNPLNDFLYRWERDLCIPIHAALFKKKIWEGGKPFNENLRAREDWAMWCEISLRKLKFYFLNRPYAVYRYHVNNMSKDRSKMIYTLFLAAYYIMQIIPDDQREKFANETISHVSKTMQIYHYPDLVTEINGLKRKFKEMDKTLDYKIGNLILKPYRLIKTKLFGKKYL